jgi:hypothetical protein
MGAIDVETNRRRGLLMLTGGAALAIGSLLPWGVFESVRVSGLEDGDGWMTLVAGLALAAAGVALIWDLFQPPPWLGWAGAGLGLLIAVFNLLDIVDAPYDLGIGMWVMLAGGALGVVGLIQRA